ncbi:MAG: hypothetical protein RR835_13335 [Peptostreptococcaceae bacterium]
MKELGKVAVRQTATQAAKRIDKGEKVHVAIAKSVGETLAVTVLSIVGFLFIIILLISSL